MFHLRKNVDRISDESKPVISDQRVYESVVFALEDSESFVRTSVYYVLTTCISSSYKHLWESFLNYEKLLSVSITILTAVPNNVMWNERM